MSGRDLRATQRPVHVYGVRDAIRDEFPGVRGLLTLLGAGAAWALVVLAFLWFVL